MKKFIFIVIVISIIGIAAYFYLSQQSKESEAEQAEALSKITSDIDGNVKDGVTTSLTASQQQNVRNIASTVYKDLSGWKSLNAAAYKYLIQLTAVEWWYFLKVYTSIYSKGFEHHVNNQTNAWKRSTELITIKSKIDQMFSTFGQQ